MNIQIRERKLLMKIAVVFVFAVMVPHWVGDYARDYQQAQERIKLGLEDKVRSYEERLSTLVDERKMVQRHMANYRHLIAQGVLVSPNQVAVVKDLEAISRARKFFPASYAFSANKIVPSADSVYTQDSTVEINIATMNLEMPMLHDLDIFMLLESLSANVDNIYFPVRCDLERLHQDFALEKKANMIGQCDLVWYWVTDSARTITHDSTGDGPGEQ